VESDIRYARNGGVAIAYQVVGSGDIDLVYVPDFMSNLVYGWEYPPWRDFYERLAGSFRLILFAKRGTGLSDYGGQFATLETRMEDLWAVLESAGSSNPVVLAGHDYLEIFLSPEVVDELERFVGGEEPPEVPDSVLAAIMRPVRKKSACS
jgi:hypothetical protein